MKLQKKKGAAKATPFFYIHKIVKSAKSGLRKVMCVCIRYFTESLFSDLYSMYFIKSSEDYIPICFATSAAKSSFFFSMPSPVSKRTNFLMVMFALFSFAT